MNKCAFVVGLALIASVPGLSQQTGWKSEHHDTMLVPPKAAHVTFIEKGNEDELTYTVDDPYPAFGFIGNLCEEMRLRKWSPSKRGVCPKPDNWIESPTRLGDQYETILNWEKWDNENNNWEYVSYDLKYTRAKNEHHLRTLHVDTYASANVAAAPKTTVPTKPIPPNPRDRWLRLGLVAAYLLIAAILLLTFWKFRSAVFYVGPGAWITWINLVLFGPVPLSFLSLGGILVSAVSPMGGPAPNEAALAAVLLTWVMLALYSEAAYVACAIVLLLIVSILLAKGIPRAVKIAHAVLGCLTLSFFVVCIVYFSGPFLHW